MFPVSWRPEGSTLACTFGDLASRSNRPREPPSRARPECRRPARFLSPKPRQVIDLWLAGVKLGLVLVPINVLYRERGVKNILADSALTVVTSRELAGFISSGARCMGRGCSHRRSRRPARRALRGSSPMPNTPMALILPPARRGLERGPCFAGEFAANGLTLMTAWTISRGRSPTLATLPLFHVHGLANGVHCWLFIGCLMRLTERFEHAKAAAWFGISDRRCTLGCRRCNVRLPLPPDRARAIGRLRLAVSSSAPLPAEVHEKVPPTLRVGDSRERYGMTETLMNVGNPYAGERRPGLMGLPLAHVAVRNLRSSPSARADGTAGELWVGRTSARVTGGVPPLPRRGAAVGSTPATSGVRTADDYITLQGGATSHHLQRLQCLSA